MTKHGICTLFGKQYFFWKVKYVTFNRILIVVKWDDTISDK